MQEDKEALGVPDGAHGRGDHGEDGVEVGAHHGHGGEQLVEVVGLVLVAVLRGAVAELLHLDEAAQAAEDGQGQDGHLGRGEDPEHGAGELAGVLEKGVGNIVRGA